MNKRKVLIVILFLFATILPFFFNYNDFDKTESIDGLIKSFETKTPDFLKRYDIPGASISLIEDGQIKWTGAFGYSDIEAEKETSKDTVYQVASISKSATAIGIMRLVEQGKINLDDPIGKYLTRWQIPASIYNENDITIKKVLSHTAGLSVGGGYPGYLPSTDLPSLEESLSGIGGGSKAVEVIREPGTLYSYSGGGYNMLQLLIEEVSGLYFSSFMKKEVLKPIKMDNSSFKWEEYLVDNTAKAYDEELELLPNFLFTELAAAGLYTTVDDLSKFVIEQINSYNGSGLLNSQTILKMYEPVLEVKGLEGFIYNNSALGHFVNIEDNNMLIAHDGGNNGWRANFSIAPDKGHGIVILTNGNNGAYLINEALNSWNFTVFEQGSSFNKIAHYVQAGVYSISLILFLWSVLVIMSLVLGLKKSTREIKVDGRKVILIRKFFHIGVLILVVYLASTILVPILSFINPNIGDILVLGIVSRLISVVLETFVQKKDINEHIVNTHIKV